MKKIKLTQGKYTLVDDCYYPMLMTVGSWCVQSKKYAASRIRGKLWLMHDLIMEWKNGPTPEGKEVDHDNLNGFDNELCNLRYATSSQNGFNRRKTSKNTSGYKGVFWHKKSQKWMAQIAFQKVVYYIGLFTSKEKAAQAYNKKAEELSKEFSNLNQVQSK